jgi:hypothetical protein
MISQIKYMNQIESKVGLEEVDTLTKEEWKAGVKELQAFIIESREWAITGKSNDMPQEQIDEMEAIRESYQSTTRQAVQTFTPQNTQLSSLKAQAMPQSLMSPGIAYRTNFGR